MSREGKRRHLCLLLGLGAAALWSQAPVSKPEAPLQTFTGDQAFEAFQKGALFLDAREPADYVYGHVPGALNLPIWAVDFEDRFQAFLASPAARPLERVVVYCGGCCSTDSLFLAQSLKDAGFKRIHVYRDGFPGWLRAGHPQVVGDAPLPGKAP